MKAIPLKTIPRLETLLVRLPPAAANELRELVQSTRIRQADFLREAVTDLLAKYREPQRGVR